MISMTYTREMSADSTLASTRLTARLKGIVRAVHKKPAARAKGSTTGKYFMLIFI